MARVVGMNRKTIQKPPRMEISVSGFKSLRDKKTIEVRPLTILAGANSSGKSSVLQAFLLMKQTLEATYDPGALLLDGPNVKFTSTDQIFSRIGKDKQVDHFEIGWNLDNEGVTLSFKKHQRQGLELAEMKVGSTSFNSGMTGDAARKKKGAIDFYGLPEGAKWTAVRDRCFLKFVISPDQEKKNGAVVFQHCWEWVPRFESILRNMIHLPGLRGNPERSYPVAAVGSTFAGTFDKYTASVIAQWQVAKNHDALEGLGRDLIRLGLSWKVTAIPVNDTQVEVHVGRLARPSKGGAWDLVSIADVGFGLSQTLPVLVALHVANKEQVVYIEQPEIHLHPRAQFAMATVLAEAALRGVYVVAETHSSILLRGVQTLVAQGKISPELVKLHWFQRREDGFTDIRSADLDEAGSFGDWPEDFDETALEVDSGYLDAAEARRAGA